MKEWYLSLSQREQRIVMIGGGLFGVFLFMQLVLAPLEKSRIKAEKQVTKYQDLLMYVNENASLINSAQQTRGGSSGSLSQSINRSARSNGIKIASTRPQGSELQVQLEDVEFNALLKWLNKLTGNGLTITALDINAGEAPGTVSVRRLQVRK